MPAKWHVVLLFTWHIATAAADVTSTQITMATGAGDVYASSCQSALWAWKQSSEQYGESHLVNSIYTTPSYVPAGPHVTATDIIKLCDGYNRAVGDASYVSSTSQTVGNQTITAKVLGPYPTPMPCSIGTSDCANLYSSYSIAASSLLGVNTTVSAPPCATNGSNSIPFSSTQCSYGGVVGVRGSSVQLLYWPVRTISDSDYFCKSYSYSDRMQSPMTLPGTPTGSGPNTFVTGSLTITSPTIALSYSGLSRIDGCGPTLDHTIITMKPEELSSVRGARSLFDIFPFNFGDLNWMCQEPVNSSSYTVQDVQGVNCYQNVPANAYWSAAQVFDDSFYASTSQVKQWTIINNYQPYILPAQSVWSETLQSIWGSTAVWYIDGVWDPPIALIEAATAAGPTLPNPATALSTTTQALTKASSTTIPAPAQLGDMLPTSTAIPLSSSAPIASYIAGGLDNHPSIATDQQSTDSAAAATGNAKGPATAVVTTIVISTYTMPITWFPGQSAAMAVVGSETLSAGGSAKNISRYIVSIVQPGVVMVHDAETTTSLTLAQESATQATAGAPSASSKFSSSSSNSTFQSTTPTDTATTATLAGSAASHPLCDSIAVLLAFMVYMLIS